MLDPFVSPPFKKCPKCNEEYFGVLSITKSSYSKRCAKCSYPRGTKDNATYHLPDIKKKIIYLDQQIISNMVKSLIPDFSKQIDPFYFEAFKKLDRLSKLQLIICPDSEFHEDESELSKFPTEHKRVYELLSHGTSFKTKWEILRFQVMEHFKNWNAGEILPETKMPIEKVVYGNVHDWCDRMIITTTSSVKDLREELIKNKVSAYGALEPALKGWSNAGTQPFEYWYPGELGHWGPNFLDAYTQWGKDLKDILDGKTPFDYFKATLSPFGTIGQSILTELQKTGKSGQDLLDSFSAFSTGPSLENVPFIRINAMVFAMVASKVSYGMKPSNITPSFMNDSLMIATVLPFCDAIFTENFLGNLLREPPLNSCLQNMPNVFSISSKDQFLAYLDQIEANAPKWHLAYVKQVYGEDWGKPFVSVFGKKA